MAKTEGRPGLNAGLEPQRAVAVLEGRFEIDLARRLMTLDSPQAMAFAAYDIQNPHTATYVLVCRPDMPGRTAEIDKVMAVDNASLSNILAAGYLDIPECGGGNFVLALERPAGGRLTGNSRGAHEPFNEDVIREVVLPALLNALAALHEKRIVHRAIRPDNLFFTDSGHTQVVLGECISAPPGFDQPAAFEPIERAMALPVGRGDGKPACDMYALGVTLLSLLQGDIPRAEKHSDLLHDRIDRGSYATLASAVLCTDAMRELLAGLLFDDPGMRWTIEDVRTWLGGRRSSPPVFRRSRSGMRPFLFLGRECYSPRAIAYGFSENVEAARLAVRDERLGNWLRRSYNDLDLSDAFFDILGDPVELAAGRVLVDDEMLAKVCLTFDPQGPVRFQGQAIMLDGFGPALSDAVLKGADDTVKTITDILVLGLPLWTLRGNVENTASQQFRTAFRAFQGFARDTQPGTGIERCLYELDLGMLCQSPMVRSAVVQNLGDLVKALNAMARGSEQPKQRPVDVHIAAFVASRMPVNQQQKARAASDRAAAGSAQCIGDLALLAMIQKSAEVGPLRNLASWLASRLEPALHAYYSQARRKRIAATLKKAVSGGDLSSVLAVINDSRERIADRREYGAAASQYASVSNEIVRAQYALAMRQSLAVSSARRVAAGIAAIVLLVVCVVTVTGSGL